MNRLWLLFDSPLDLVSTGLGALAFCAAAGVWVAVGQLWVPLIGTALLVAGALGSWAIPRVRALTSTHVTPHLRPDVGKRS
jgi:hypothetical protein